MRAMGFTSRQRGIEEKMTLRVGSDGRMRGAGVVQGGGQVAPLLGGELGPRWAPYLNVDYGACAVSCVLIGRLGCWKATGVKGW